MDPKTAFLSTRPWSFTMTFSAVTMGTLMAALTGKFSPPVYLLTLGGMVAFHAATNVLNDFFDVRHGVDREGAPTTKYRLHPAAFGQTRLSSILGLSLGLYAVTMLAGVYLAFLSTLSILLIVVAGIAGSVLYTADPVVLKARALGEATVFVMWGVLIPLGSYMTETGGYSLSPVVAAIPIGIFVGLVLLANNIRDIAYDGSVDNRTLAVALGAPKAVRLYVALLWTAYALVVVGMLAQLLPIWSFAVFLTVPEARSLAKMFGPSIPDDSDPRTAALAFKFALLYMASLLVAVFFPVTLPF
ncbi:MAG: prenyltransferase [Nitrososphaerota archaeon]|nr:prenyltransferase [Nitrososphaerota archaeon]MDG7024487.1 prenyltransferase [Nitrososphaerota archaeon]